jgi:hypothetical protein
MSGLYFQEHFDSAKDKTHFYLFCDFCYSVFSRKKKVIKDRFIYYGSTNHYCNYKCFCASKPMVEFHFECGNCKKQCSVPACGVKQSKSGFYFCSQSCSATYNNTHKKYGIRRSKLEKWLEEQLTVLYPNLEIHYSRKDAVNSELDIYIPSLKLAFELNGIFHYEPIFGQEQLDKTQNNDGRKFQACLERGIELCILDTSKVTYSTPKNYKQFLDIIINIISTKLYL